MQKLEILREEIRNLGMRPIGNRVNGEAIRDGLPVAAKNLLDRMGCRILINEITPEIKTLLSEGNNPVVLIVNHGYALAPLVGYSLASGRKDSVLLAQTGLYDALKRWKSFRENMLPVDSQTSPQKASDQNAIDQFHLWFPPDDANPAKLMFRSGRSLVKAKKVLNAGGLVCYCPTPGEENMDIWRDGAEFLLEEAKGEATIIVSYVSGIQIKDYGRLLVPRKVNKISPRDYHVRLATINMTNYTDLERKNLLLAVTQEYINKFK